MSNGRGKRAKRRVAPVAVPAVDRTPPWSVVYYQASDGTVPALEFLDGCPGKLDGEFTAVLDAVATAPPPQFSGGGKWEAMHGEMTGYHEIRRPAQAVADRPQHRRLPRGQEARRRPRAPAPTAHRQLTRRSAQRTA